MSAFRSDLYAGKVVFVTGGASGICKGIALSFMQHGADCAIISRRQDRLDASAKELVEKTGRRCVGFAADVRDPKAVEAAVDQALQTFGKIDIVINGAAGNFLCPVENLSYNAFRTVMEIDTMGTYNVSKACFTKWLKEHGGNIINISATLHYAGSILQAHAGAAKAAVDALTKHMAVEWGPLGIRVNAVAPGPIDETEGLARLAPKKIKDKLTQVIPAQRFGVNDDIANACLYLASNAASYVTGHIMVVDGGQWLTFANAGFADDDLVGAWSKGKNAAAPKRSKL